MKRGRWTNETVQVFVSSAGKTLPYVVSGSREAELEDGDICSSCPEVHQAVTPGVYNPEPLQHFLSVIIINTPPPKKKIVFETHLYTFKGSGINRVTCRRFFCQLPAAASGQEVVSAAAQTETRFHDNHQAAAHPLISTFQYQPKMDQV